MIKKIIWSLLFIVLFGGAILSYLYKFKYDSGRISIGKLIHKTGIPSAALLVLDIQEGTTGNASSDKAYQAASDTLIAHINDVIRVAQCRRLPVVYVKNEINDFLINLLNNSMKKGSEGAKLDKRLNVVSGYIYPKRKQDAFSNPEMDEFLRISGVNELFITGLDAAYCIKSTIIAAKQRGYTVYVIREAILADSDEAMNAMISWFGSKGVTVLSLGEFKEIFGDC